MTEIATFHFPLSSIYEQPGAWAGTASIHAAEKRHTYIANLKTRSSSMRMPEQYIDLVRNYALRSERYLRAVSFMQTLPKLFLKFRIICWRLIFDWVKSGSGTSALSKFYAYFGSFRSDILAISCSGVPDEHVAMRGYIFALFPRREVDCRVTRVSHTRRSHRIDTSSLMLLPPSRSLLRRPLTHMCLPRRRSSLFESNPRLGRPPILIRYWHQRLLPPSFSAKRYGRVLRQ